MLRKSIKVLGGVLLITTLAGGAVNVSANNYKDSRFDFVYYCDGGEVFTDGRTKMDDSATYVKCDYRSEPFDAGVYGTNNYKSWTGGNDCSGMKRVNPGSHVYISNSVYGRYKYAELELTLRDHPHDNSKHRFGGWWSPDNYEGIR